MEFPSIWALPGIMSSPRRWNDFDGQNVIWHVSAQLDAFFVSYGVTAAHLGNHSPKNHKTGCEWIGIFKPHLQNVKTGVSKTTASSQPNFARW